MFVLMENISLFGVTKMFIYLHVLEQSYNMITKP